VESASDRRDGQENLAGQGEQMSMLGAGEDMLMDSEAGVGGAGGNEETQTKADENEL